MAAAPPPAEESSVSYEELNDLNAEFDDAETELIRQEAVVKQLLYEKRRELVSQIPNFWPLVFEQAPPDIDEFIQPSDSSLLLNSLISLSVTRFEIEDGKNGDPRSLCFRFEFSDNDHFEDKVIEKKFWQRHSKSGGTALVSEPVEIHWKKGKDLTGGLLGTVKKVWDAQQARAKGGDTKTQGLSADEKSLKKKIENTGLGGLSFFAWFGYVGRNISAEESQEAVDKAQKKRIARQEGKDQNAEGEEKEGDDDDEDDENDLEIFPEGDSLAIHISEDLWPNAIKYFIQAQEQDEASDEDFESDADEDNKQQEEEEASEEEPPAKRRKT
ncbi:nucleosome assembly factor-2 [Diaporthe helianthi]|uniref:Nucleosome assembly factor-2 n=1 Tax=Diaporthe helianthi TaxID=158607 RepID=A0A2P5IBY6_DIAHE|nr:nucleosome assembly factor-2 [Diaporthe helianthi]